MPNDRILRAVLRLDPDRASISSTVDDVERVEASVEGLSQAVEELSLGQRIQAGVGRAVSGLQFGKLADETVERLEFLGDGFEQLIDTLDELGIQTEDTIGRIIRTASLLNRVSFDPIGAGIAALGEVGKAWGEFQDKLDEGAQRVGQAFDEVLGQEFRSATELAQEYAAAQARVSEAHDRGGIIADILIDKYRLLNENQEDVQEALSETAVDYQDYVAAVGQLNASRAEGARILPILTEAEFELLRVRTQGLANLGQTVGQVAAAVAEAVAEAAETTTGMDDLVDDFEQFQTDLNAAFEDFQAERARIDEQYSQRLGEIEARTGERRQAIMEQFIAQSEAAETAYYSRRAEIIAQAGLAAARAEQDHQRRMQRMREDAALRERDLIDARDALGLKRARQENERQRRRADEDFNLQQARSSEDVARQLEQMRVAFEAQQAERQQNYERQLREQEVNTAKEQARLEAENDSRQRELETAYRTEQSTIRGAFDRRRQDLGIFLAGEEAALRRHYERTARQLEAWLERTARAVASVGRGARRRQEGGYVGAGLYQVGERGREFVLSHATTRAAEARTGGALTQAAILGAMGGSKQTNISLSFNVSGAQDPQRTARMVERQLFLAMDRLLDEVS